jgi:phosphatidylinositol alpha-1,6-mannosyltransferase
LRIALLTTDSVPIIGGVSNYLHNLCAELAKRAALSVYSSVPSAYEYDSSLPYEIKRIPETRQLGNRFADRIPPVRKLNTMLWHLKKPYEADELVRKVRRECFPSVIFIGRWEESSHFWCRACRAEGVPYYLFAYGMELKEKKTDGWRRRRQRDFLEAERVVSISTTTTEVLKAFGVNEHRTIWLPPGIPPSHSEKISSESLDDLRSQLGLANNPYILSMSRLVRRKGVDLAIRAFEEIVQDFPNTLLIIAGDGPLATALHALAKGLSLDNRVRFLGEVDEPTKLALLQGCEFFVMPNRPIPGDMEGFGIVFLEAAMFGKAVIGGNNGGVPDAVIHGETGLLVDTSETHKAVSEGMRMLISDQVFARRLGNAGKKRVHGKFCWDYLCERFLANCNRLILHLPDS